MILMFPVLEINMFSIFKSVHDVYQTDEINASVKSQEERDQAAYLYVR